MCVCWVAVSIAMVLGVCSPHGSAATPEYDSRQSTLDYSPSSAEDYDTWYVVPCPFFFFR